MTLKRNEENEIVIIEALGWRKNGDEKVMGRKWVRSDLRQMYFGKSKVSLNSN